MAMKTTNAKPRRRPLPEPMTPLLVADGWYWSEWVRDTFDMSRATVAELKRQCGENEVGGSRMGDVIKGSAVIRWLTSRKSKAKPS